MKKNNKIFEKTISFILLISLLLNLFTIDAFGNVSNDVNEFNEYSLEEYENLSLIPTINAIMPENNNFLLNDLGLNNGLLIDIKKAQSFSLLNRNFNNDVLLDASIFNDGEVVDVIHFVEDPYYINEDTIIINVSHYSDESKSILNPAIQAYQESFDSSDECVAIEIFENITVENGQINFETDSFSIFAVGNVALTTYEFYVDNILVNTQYLLGNLYGKDILYQPESPIKKGFEFLGWKNSISGEYITFGEIDINTTDDVLIRCDADFNNVYYVYFLYEAKEGGYILDTLSGKPGDVIYTDLVDYPINLDKHVISWHSDVDLTSAPITEVTLVDSDIILYPNIQEGHWLTFYSNGGSLVEPCFYAIDEVIAVPPNPTKTGYIFTGWYDENNQLFDFTDKKLDKNIVLNAVWEAQEVNYTIQLVMQNPDEPTVYDPILGGIFTKQALAGTTISGSDIPESDITACINGLGADSYFKGYLKYFYYNSAITGNETVEIEGDGSSVIHIYYDRYVTELRFFLSYDDTEPYITRAGLFDQRMAESAWPILSDAEFEGFAGWEQSKGGSRPTWNGAYRFGFTYNAEEDIFIYNLYAVGGGGLTHAIKYYVQAINPDGTVPDVGVTLDTIPNEPHVDIYNPLTLGNEDNQVLIDNWSNVDFESASASEVTNNGAWVLDGMDTYTANGTHTGIAYRHGIGSIPGFTAIAVGFDLYNNVGDGTEYRMDSFKDHPKLPNSYIDYWATSKKVAQGMGTEIISSKTYYHLDSDKWYAVSEPFRAYKFFGDIYLRLLRNRYNIQFIVDGNKVADYNVYYETDLGIDKFTSISEVLTPPDGYIFGGWHTSPSLTEDTRFYLERNTMPYNDLVLYAKWVPIKVELDVHITLDGTDTIIEGYNGFTIKYGERVDRKQVDELKASVNIPDEAIWYGWYERVNVGGGKTLLVPFNFDVELTKDLVLYPFYSYITPVHLEYDLNGGTGITPVDNFSYALGKGAVVLPNTDINPPDNKIFIGWNTRADGSGKTYYPGDIAVIDINELKLYAMYGDKPEIGEVSLTYINTVSLESISNTYSEFETISISDISIFNEYVSKRYIFKEWNTKADGTGDSFNVGDSVVLTADSENILYAIYTESELPILNIPISKTLMYYNSSETIKFYFNAVLCDEFGIELTPNAMFEGFINVTGSENIVGEFEVSFEESQLINGNTMYYKIYEIEDFSKPVIYDKNYYIIKVEIISNIPQITNVNKYDEFGNQIAEFVYDDELVFLNKYLVDIDALPNTGGNGSNIFVVSGSFFCILGLVWCSIYFKNKKR